MTDRDAKPDIHALAEATLEHHKAATQGPMSAANVAAIAHARAAAPILAGFALAVMEALEECEKWSWQIPQIRAAIARNMEARRG